jgi:hypothetical protein
MPGLVAALATFLAVPASILGNEGAHRWGRRRWLQSVMPLSCLLAMVVAFSGETVKSSAATADARLRGEHESRFGSADCRTAHRNSGRQIAAQRSRCIRRSALPVLSSGRSLLVAPSTSSAGVTLLAGPRAS